MELSKASWQQSGQGNPGKDAGFTGCIGFIGFVGFIGSIGFTGFIGFIGFIGFAGFKRVLGFNRTFFGLRGFIGLMVEGLGFLKTRNKKPSRFRSPAPEALLGCGPDEAMCPCRGQPAQDEGEAAAPEPGGALCEDHGLFAIKPPESNIQSRRPHERYEDRLKSRISKS